MKYILILGDGMSDYRIDKLGNKTPLEVADKPNIDKLALYSEIGLVKTIPEGMKPGSDTANLSVMGYDPRKYYTGRSPLEAISMGISLNADDIAVRANLVTLSDEVEYSSKRMLDYSAGEISTAEAKTLIKYIQKHLKSELINYYAGVSYRHCMVMSKTTLGTELTPPHDISGKIIGEYLPKGLNGNLFLSIMQQSYELLNNHPVNIRRIAEGKKPANSLWLWGEGVRPSLPKFSDLYNMKGAVISAVDLIKGIGIASGMKSIDVRGATGTIHTNFIGKANACLKALKEGADYVYLHIEAADECSHQGDLEGKIKAIELIDNKVVARIVNGLNKDKEEYSILILPDHPTPISTRTHASDPVPYLMFRSNVRRLSGRDTYCERTAEESGIILGSGSELMRKFFSK